MGTLKLIKEKYTIYRWTICGLLFFTTTINYLNRQILSLLQPLIKYDFHWSDSDYGTITATISLAYAFTLPSVGRIIDKLSPKSSVTIIIAMWSTIACLSALSCFLIEKIVDLPDSEVLCMVTNRAVLDKITSWSILIFVVIGCIIAMGEAGNFPSITKAAIECFPNEKLSFATDLFNSGVVVGIILAALISPFLATAIGWSKTFLVFGIIGFICLILWLLLYRSPQKNASKNNAKSACKSQDNNKGETVFCDPQKKISIFSYLKYRQVWAFAFGKLMTDGVWWFFIFWTPAYLVAEYGLKMTELALPMALLYFITVFGSIFVGKLPNYYVNKGMESYSDRMRTMIIIALFSLLVLFVQPLGHLKLWNGNGYWIAIILIGLSGLAHRAWAANILPTLGVMIPNEAITSISCIGGMAGGIGSFVIQKCSGIILDYSLVEWGSKYKGYTIIFTFCALAYLIGWNIIKILVPQFKPIENA